jgi:hypothetical protein
MLFIKPKEVWENLSITLKEEICAEMQAVIREVIDEQFRAHSASSQGPESGDLHSAVHGASGAHECGEPEDTTRHAGERQAARVG